MVTALRSSRLPCSSDFHCKSSQHTLVTTVECTPAVRPALVADRAADPDRPRRKSGCDAARLGNFRARALHCRSLPSSWSPSVTSVIPSAFLSNSRRVFGSRSALTGQLSWSTCVSLLRRTHRALCLSVVSLTPRRHRHFLRSRGDCDWISFKRFPRDVRRMMRGREAGGGRPRGRSRGRSRARRGRGASSRGRSQASLSRSPEGSGDCSASADE